MEVYADGSYSTCGAIKWGFIVIKDGVSIHSDLGYRHHGTVNLAEYMAVSNALQWCIDECKGMRCTVYTDSELVLNQVSGRYRCRSKHLRPWRDMIVTMLTNSKSLGVVLELRKVASADNLADELVSNTSISMIKGMEDYDVRAYLHDASELG